MSKPTTIASEWQDYYDQCYHEAPPPEVLAEHALAFYSGWYACIGALAKMSIATPAERDASREMVAGWQLEFEAFATQFIQQRRAQLQRDE